MSDFSKALRWAAPGAAMIGFATLVVLSQLFFSGRHLSISAISGSHLAAMSLATLPSGFTIYQWYFFSSNRAPILMNYVHKDVGREVLDAASGASLKTSIVINKNVTPVPRYGLHLRLGDWTIPGTGSVSSLWVDKPAAGRLGKRGGELRGKLQAYYIDRGKNWVQMESWLGSQSIVLSPRHEKEIDRLAEIYHALGATRLGAVIGVFAGTTWCLVSPGLHLPETMSLDSVINSIDVGRVVTTIAAGALVSSIAIWFVVVLHLNRENCSRRRSEILTFILDSQQAADNRLPSVAVAAEPKRRTLWRVLRLFRKRDAKSPPS